MTKLTKIISAVAVVLVIVGAGYYVTSSRSGSQPTQESKQKQTKISYSGQDGKSVCQILKETHQVESSESSYGEMVKSIDGLVSTDNEFWLYSVNDTPGDVSCDKKITTSQDRIIWEYKGM